jgi:hypothetical protein
MSCNILWEKTKTSWFFCGEYSNLISIMISQSTHIEHINEFYWTASVLFDSEDFNVPRTSTNRDQFGFCKTLEEAKRESIISVKEQLLDHISFFNKAYVDICSFM